jgi:hypothetical protein
MNARLDESLYFPGKDRRWGEFPPEGGEHFAEALAVGGQIATKDVPAETCYTNALVPEINKFDTAAIVQRAKAAN